MIRQVVVTATVVAAGLAASLVAPEAHKTVVSRFTYYQDVRPILDSRCGRCHDGGVASTLLTYDAAAASTWAIQQELLSRRMPPWNADDGLAPIKGHESLSILEFDTLMTWAAGGAPRGTAPASTRPAIPVHAWPLGTPDLKLSMPVPAVVARDRVSLDHEVVMPLTAAAGKWIRAVDLRPGTPAIVRRAELSMRSGSGADVLLGLWLPGDAPQAFEADAAFRVPANASLVMRLQYQKPAAFRDDAMEDRSDAGLYFGNARTSRPVQTAVIGDDADTPFGSSRVITQAIDRASRIVSVRPISGPRDATARLVIVDPNGARTSIMRLTLRDEWPRRYVLAAPIRVPGGSRVEVTVTASPAAIWETLTGDRPAPPAAGGPLRIAIETVTP